MFEALRRRKEIVAICTVAVPAAVLFVSLLEDPVYEATATVLVRVHGGAQVSTDEAIELAGADEVVEGTETEVGGEDPEQVSERVVADPGAQPGAFTIQASGVDPDHAARLANTYAEEFVEYSEGLGTKFPATAEVVGEAVEPDSPASPSTVRNTLLGVAAGFMLGVALALLWERFRRTEPRPAPATAVTGWAAGRRRKPVEAPTLADGPELAGDPEPVPDSPVDLNSATHEQLRALDLSTTQARRLLSYRERLGGFSSVDDIDEVPGFPDRVRAELKQRVRV